VFRTPSCEVEPKSFVASERSFSRCIVERLKKTSSACSEIRKHVIYVFDFDAVFGTKQPMLMNTDVVSLD
jgi:hypothetical protein